MQLIGRGRPRPGPVPAACSAPLLRSGDFVTRLCRPIRRAFGVGAEKRETAVGRKPPSSLRRRNRHIRGHNMDLSVRLTGCPAVRSPVVLGIARAVYTACVERSLLRFHKFPINERRSMRDLWKELDTRIT